MQLKILSSAVEDINSGRQFYESQNIGLGDYFLDSIFSDIDSLIIFAGIHVKQFDFFRALSKRFPFAIYYEMPSENEVLVFRVLDLRQDPKKLAGKLKG